MAGGPARHRASAWRDPLDGPLGDIMSAYGERVPRRDARVVERLLRAAAPPRPAAHVAVVGSNGKTSTATLMARMLAPATRVGLFTSPHIARWSERVRVNDEPCDEDALLEAVARVHALAQRPDLRSPEIRFFDVLTIAAEELLGHAGVQVAVFEAGIGGRRDAVAALAPELVVLTTVDLEHTELLGSGRPAILREKLGLARPGATVVTPPLDPELDALAGEVIAEQGAIRRRVGVEGHPFPERNHALAREASRVAGELLLGRAAPESAEEVPAEVTGRFQAGTVRGVRYVADAGHNPAAWRAFLGALGPPEGAVAVVALTRQRSIEQLAAALAEGGGFAHVYATAARVRPTHDPDEIARVLATRGITATACPAPDRAFERAAVDARQRDTRLVVFGSTYLITDFLAWVRGSSQSSSERQSHSSPR